VHPGIERAAGYRPGQRDRRLHCDEQPELQQLSLRESHERERQDERARHCDREKHDLAPLPDALDEGDRSQLRNLREEGDCGEQANDHRGRAELECEAHQDHSAVKCARGRCPGRILHSRARSPRVRSSGVTVSSGRSRIGLNDASR
jgi:hypothetical protein